MGVRAKRPRKAVDNKLYPDLNEASTINFEEALVICSTTAARKSHLKKIATILRRKCRDPQLPQLDDKTLLDRHYTAEGLHTVAAALAAEKLSLGPNYISSW